MLAPGSPHQRIAFSTLLFSARSARRASTRRGRSRAPRRRGGRGAAPSSPRRVLAAARVVVVAAAAAAWPCARDGRRPFGLPAAPSAAPAAAAPRLLRLATPFVCRPLAVRARLGRTCGWKFSHPGAPSPLPPASAPAPPAPAPTRSARPPPARRRPRRRRRPPRRRRRLGGIGLVAAFAVGRRTTPAPRAPFAAVPPPCSTPRAAFLAERSRRAAPRVMYGVARHAPRDCGPRLTGGILQR